MEHVGDWLSEPLSAQTVGAAAVDVRLGERLGKVLDALVERPDESFPEALGDEAALEGAYRLLRNPRLDVSELMAGHIQATVSRIERVGEALVLHDTTKFEFEGQGREGLGRVKQTSRRTRHGFFGHFALAVSADSSRVPLGVVGLTAYARTKAPRGHDTKEARRRDPDRESLRWGRLVDEVRGRFEGTPIVHVMDREGDDYSLLAEMVLRGDRFIVRMRCDRPVVGRSEEFAYEAAKKFPAIFEREVRLAARRKNEYPGPQTKHPPRESRFARLSFSVGTLDLKRPGKKTSTELTRSLRLNVVRIFEVGVPDGVVPIEWRLITTEPVTTVGQVEWIVDSYRARWTIEDYFKALKTGCAFEKRQLESFFTIRKALALFAPVAWRLLLLRAVSRQAPHVPAKMVLTRTQLDVLRAMARRPLPQTPTARDAMLAVAAIGGHIRNNGDPGWRVLGRGHEKLRLYEAGWLAARSASRDVINE